MRSKFRSLVVGLIICILILNNFVAIVMAQFSEASGKSLADNELEPIKFEKINPEDVAKEFNERRNTAEMIKATDNKVKATDDKIKALDDFLKQKGFSAKTKAEDSFGAKATYKSKDEEGVEREKVSSLKINDYEKKGSKDIAAIAEIEVESGGEKQTYSFVLIAPDGDINKTEEYAVSALMESGGKAQVSKATNAWWSCTKDLLKKTCSKACVGGLTWCWSTLTWPTYIACITGVCGGCFAVVSGICAVATACLPGTTSCGDDCCTKATEKCVNDKCVPKNTCPQGTTTCGNDCCEANEACVNGQCVPQNTCPQGTFSCADDCCSIATEKCANSQCMPLDNLCPPGMCKAHEVCVDGRCVPQNTCLQGTTTCGNDCCEANEACVNGWCVSQNPTPWCQQGTTTCGNDCCDVNEACLNGQCVSNSDTSGSAKVMTVSSRLKGYTVEVDGVQIGIEGTGSDTSDGVYTFYVAGNQQHAIKVNHPQYWKSWNDFFMAGGSYTANIDVPGRVVLSN
jgi:hypothetical protein